MALPGRRVLVVYGTETGNSQDKAEEIDRLCQRLHFRTELEEIDDIKLNTLLTGFDLIVFVISTTGQGQFPRNALRFWKSLRRAKLPPGCLSPVHFTVFGLGDSAYKKFNFASRLLRSRLLGLGAQEAFERGEADERHDDGIDSIYQPWVAKLRGYLLTSFPLPAHVEPIPDNQPLPPRYFLRTVPFTEAEMAKGKEKSGLDKETLLFLASREKNAALSHVERPQPSQEQFDDNWDRESLRHNVSTAARRDLESASKTLGRARVDVLDKANILKDSPEKYLLKSPPTPSTIDFPPPTSLPIPDSTLARVLENKRVTPPDHWQDVRLLSLDVVVPIYNDMETVALPGDVLVLYPQNYPSDVQALIDMMDWGAVADEKVVFNNGRTPKGLYYYERSTLRDLLTNNIDFTAIPTRMFLEKLAAFATNADQKEKLLELIKPSFSSEFYDFTSRPRRTILEVLAEFHSAKIPVSHIPDMFPVIRGREYSIANGGRHWRKESFRLQEPAQVSEEELRQRGSAAGGPGSIPAEATVRQTGYSLYHIELLIALVEYKTVIRKPRQGLCSHYVKHLPVDTLIQVSTRRQSLPPSGKFAAERPMIAIATGTGIAPIRSLIHDRALFEDAAETLLFFGCRNRKADFYFNEEWEKTGRLIVIPAFSRDPKTDDEAMIKLEEDLDARMGNTDYAPLRASAGLPPVDTASTGILSFGYDQGKNYVQRIIRRQAHRICKLLERGASICLCGNSGRMPKSVRAALCDAAVTGGFCIDTSEAEAVLFSDKAHRKVIFWEETW